MRSKKICSNDDLVFANRCGAKNFEIENELMGVLCTFKMK